MAISKIKPRHASEGRSIAAVLKDRIDYDKNPDKTKGGLPAAFSGIKCSGRHISRCLRLHEDHLLGNNICLWI